jgi:hypothetical protein
LRDLFHKILNKKIIIQSTVTLFFAACSSSSSNSQVLLWIKSVSLLWCGNNHQVRFVARW